MSLYDMKRLSVGIPVVMQVCVHVCVYVCVCVLACCSVLGVEDGCSEETTPTMYTQPSSEVVPKKKTALQYAGVLQTKGSKHFKSKCIIITIIIIIVVDQCI